MANERQGLDQILDAVPVIPSVQQDERQITDIIERRREATGETFGPSVTFEGETYRRSPDGKGWSGPGGNYGDITLLGQKLQKELAKLQQE